MYESDPQYHLVSSGKSGPTCTTALLYSILCKSASMTKKDERIYRLARGYWLAIQNKVNKSSHSCDYKRFHKAGNDKDETVSGAAQSANMFDLKRYLPFDVSEEHGVNAEGYDGLLFVSVNGQAANIEEVRNSVEPMLKLDPTLASEIAILPLPTLPAGRLVYAPTGPLDTDYDDVRSLRETALKGTQKALKAGIKRLLVIIQEVPDFFNSELVILLGVLQALYVPIQVRELAPTKLPMIEKLGIYSATNKDRIASIIQNALVLDSGLRIAKDIGDADPERMTPQNILEYVKNAFADSSLTIDVIENADAFAEEYPLFEAVNRATKLVNRHQGRIVYLEYNPADSSKVTETLIFVGKGVTYDTGGVDVKAGGVMAGMSRDKCGAAAVAGFMQVVNLLKPDNVRVIGALSLVRNSIGSNAYVSDELIKARSGALVRIGNTDAEGRMIMADVLCRMKEVALDAINPHLFTVATLTGHAHLTVGTGYSIVLDNGPARNAGTSSRILNAGSSIADPFEVSTIRREDLAFHRGKALGDDVLQSNNLPSSRTSRGHQAPAAFLILASGLDKHGSGSEKPLKYSHLDIAGSAGDFPDPATGAPILALANAFILSR